jgi:hypothetical protein
MSTGRLLALGVIVSLPLWFTVPPAEAKDKHPATEATRSGRAGGACASDVCADVWKFQCAAASMLHADVTDSGAPLDDVLMVALVGTLPAAIKGKASVQLTAPGGSTPGFAELAAGTNTTIAGFAVITVVSDTGDADYTTDLHCHKKDGTTVQPGTITLIQDSE